MSYYGDVRLGDTIDIKFTTRQISGAPTTLAGSPVISAYPANSVTQLTAGITLSVDFDSVTGLNNIRVVASGGNGYLTATNYELVITTGTVNSVSVVGECVGGFSIENRSALMPTTAARTLVVDAAGLADANVVKLGPTGSGTAQTARDVGASVLLSTGTGTGQLDFTSGVVKANLAQILATALTETAGLLAGGFKKFFNVSSPTGTLNSIPDVVAGAAGGLFIAGTNAATTVTTALTTTFTGNLTGSVASVTGAVGSVTGAVGSVTGAVGSVTARVTANTDQLAGQTVTAAAGVTFPTSVASPTNITAGTITTATNLTTNNDKSGYSLTQTFPSNFATIVVSASGIVDVNVKKIDGVTIIGDGSATPFTV